VLSSLVSGLEPGLGPIGYGGPHNDEIESERIAPPTAGASEASISEKVRSPRGK
jgi:hypothetical protein